MLSQRSMRCLTQRLQHPAHSPVAAAHHDDHVGNLPEHVKTGPWASVGEVVNLPGVEVVKKLAVQFGALQTNVDWCDVRNLMEWMAWVLVSVHNLFKKSHLRLRAHLSSAWLGIDKDEERLAVGVGWDLEWVRPNVGPGLWAGGGPWLVTAGAGPQGAPLPVQHCGEDGGGRQHVMPGLRVRASSAKVSNGRP